MSSLVAANPSGTISQARVMDLASAAQDLRDDRRLDPMILWSPCARSARALGVPEADLLAAIQMKKVTAVIPCGRS